VTARDKAPQAIADLLAGLDIDAADVIATQAKESADKVLAWARSDEPVEPFGSDGGPWGEAERGRQIDEERGQRVGREINAFFFAKRDVVKLLGRDLTDAESVALEACVRHYLQAGTS
jgi:hypothetical protein